MTTPLIKVRSVLLPLLGGPMLLLLLLLSLSSISLAQEAALTVRITGVSTSDDGTEAPSVAAFVSVLDAGGLPVMGLAPANFEIIGPDGVHPQRPIRIETDVGRPLALGLALDVSLDQAADLDFIKAAALSLIDTLGPEDELILLAFHDQVQTLFQGQVGDGAAVRQRLDTLEGRGDRTAFYRAARSAADILADRAGPGRPAIVMVTNIGNNINDPAAAEARQAVAAGTVPLHVVCFGHRVKTGPLQTLSRQTGGQLLHLAAADNLPDSLPRLGVLLRQGYQVTFQPDLQAGPVATYPFSIQVTTPRGTTGRAEATVALDPRPVRLVLWGVRDLAVGQTLQLTAAVTGPEPVASLRYRIDDYPATLATARPYSFTWTPSGPDLGRHTLVVTVTGRTGSQAVAPTTFNVGPPQTRPGPDLTWGQAIVLEAPSAVESAGSRVAFWLEETFIGATEAPPYRLLIDPTHPGYPSRPENPARSVFKTRLTDRSGRITEDSVAVTVFAPAPVVSRTGPLAGGLLLVVGNLVLLPFLLLVWGLGHRRRKRNLVAAARLTLRNRGNVPASFRLEVMNTEPAGPLQFRLPKESVVSLLKVGKTQLRPSPVKIGQQPRLIDSQPVARSWPQGLRLAGGCLGRLVDTLDTFSSIPLLGTPFRVLVGQLRRSQSEATRLGRMPQQLMTPVRRLGRTPGPAASGVTSTRRELPASVATPNRPEPSAQPPVATKKRPVPAVHSGSAGTGWAPNLSFTTLAVIPEETLTLVLYLRPVRLPPRLRCYPVRLAARPVEGIDDIEIAEAQTTETQVMVEGVPGWYRHFGILAPLVVLLMLAVDLIWLAGLVYIIGTGLR